MPARFCLGLLILKLLQSPRDRRRWKARLGTPGGGGRSGGASTVVVRRALEIAVDSCDVSTGTGTTDHHVKQHFESHEVLMARTLYCLLLAWHRLAFFGFAFLGGHIM